MGRPRGARPWATAIWIPALALMAGAGSWRVAHAVVGMPSSIDVDATGVTRVAYFDLFHGSLELASRSSTSGAWSTERIDSRGGRGQTVSLADSAGVAAVAYYDQQNADLIYAKRLGGAWSFCRVDAAGDVGSFCSLKFGPRGAAIAYYDATNGDLKLATWGVSGWTIVTVDSNGDVGKHCSLAFDFTSGDTAAHIAYYDATGAALKRVRRVGGIWTPETVDAGGVGEYCSIGIDGSRGPRISYFDANGSGQLKFASWSTITQSWTRVVVDPAAGTGRYSSLRFDNNRRPRIAYYDAVNGDLKFATGTSTPSSWSLEVLDQAGDVGRHAAVAVDPQGNPQAVGYHVNGGALRLATFAFGHWTVVTVDAQTRTGRFSSLAIDASGVAHVGFFDVVHGRLMYARRAGSGWSFETVDDSDQAGQYVSLVLEGGEPRLAYFDATEGELRYARRAAGGGWTVEVADGTGIAGMFSSLALDGSGDPHIAYFDARNEALKYASRSGVGWNVETIPDAGPGRGLYSSLAIRGSTVGIAYYDALSGDLKFASRSGGPWSIETIESPGNVGQYTSLALDASGTFHLGYHDMSALTPRYAIGTPGSWTTEPVDTAGSGGQYISLALSGSTPHIAYYHEAHSSLRYGVRSGGWAAPREVVDNNGNVGLFGSLALDGAGSPRAVYFDAVGHDLKYVTRDASARWTRVGLDGEFPRIHVWAFTGAFEDNTDQYIGTTECAGRIPPAPDSSRTRARTLTVRFLRDRRAEARPDFGGYRIYRVTQTPDSTRMELIRRYSRQRGDFLGWYMSVVDTTDPALALRCGGELAHDSIATFVDPDSNGHYEKFCPEVLLNRCLKDSVFRLVAPPGPHDGIATYYAVTIEGRNTGVEGTYEELFVPGPDPDTRNNYQLCEVVGDPSTCPPLNINTKLLNVTPLPTDPQGTLEPTGGPTNDLERVLVVPNPYRAAEVWDRPGAHEVHFINLPQKATIKIYTVAGDLVAQLEHNDPVRDFEPWDLKNGKGREVASGIYIYRIESPKCDECVPPVPVAFALQNRLVVIR